MTNHRAAARRLPVDQLREQAVVIGHDVQELGSIAKVAAQETIEDGRKLAQQTIADGRKRVQQVEKSFEDIIRDNPVRSVLIAAGVGLTVSLVLGRRWF